MPWLVLGKSTRDDGSREDTPPPLSEDDSCFDVSPEDDTAGTTEQQQERQEFSFHRLKQGRVNFFQKMPFECGDGRT